MKPARIIVLIIAVVAGGIAALLAGRSPEPPPAPAPVAQIETTDVLVANSDIGLGHAVAERDLRWQMWPTAAAGPNFIRKNDRPESARTIGPMPSAILQARSRVPHFPPTNQFGKPS